MKALNIFNSFYCMVVKKHEGNPFFFFSPTSGLPAVVRAVVSSVVSDIKRESKEDEENRSLADLSDDDKDSKTQRSRTRCSVNRSH